MLWVLDVELPGSMSRTLGNELFVLGTYSRNSLVRDQAIGVVVLHIMVIIDISQREHATCKGP